jgi:hypothetical protein
VVVNGKYGYIDKNGKLVIEPKFDMAKKFFGGLSWVEIGGMSGYIAKNGKYVWSPVDKYLRLEKEWKINEDMVVPNFDIDGKGRVYLPLPREIKIYSKEGMLLRRIVGSGTFKRLVSTVVDKNGYIYVGDGERRTIYKLSYNGKVIKKWELMIPEKLKGVDKKISGKFFGMLRIDKDSSNNIYAIDPFQVYKFDSDGNLLSILEIPPNVKDYLTKTDSTGNLYFMLRTLNKILIYNFKEKIKEILPPKRISQSKDLSFYNNLSIDEKGNIYLLFSLERLIMKVNKNNDRVELFCPREISTKIPVGIKVSKKWYYLLSVLPIKRNEEKSEFYFQIYKII